jgi:ribosomal protein S18 acetylase RimI-like enzyme
MACIRPYRPDDVDALYRICLETGDSGQDATHLYTDPRILGEVFAAPYGHFEPELAFVVEDEDGVGGYVLGALDTRAFEERLERDWWPALRARYPDPEEIPPTERTPDQQVAYMMHHRRGAYSQTDGYPSHLHIDILPRLQGGGSGRRLISTLLEALRHRGSPGVHLGVGIRNENAIGFYRHVGFQELGRTDYGILFGMKLAAEKESESEDILGRT